MKRNFTVFGFALAIVFIANSCDELLDKLNINFDIGPENVQFEIPPEEVGSTFESYDVVYHDMKKEVEDNGGDLEKLDSVLLRKATVTILEGAENFNNFESFEVFIETPTIEKTKIAWMEEILLDTNQIVPNLTGDNIKDYMYEGEYTIILNGVVREEFTEPIKLNAEIFFSVNL